MRVLFASYLRSPSASGRQRCEALQSLGHEVTSFSFDGYDRQTRITRKLNQKLRARAYLTSDLERLGREFAAAVAALQPELAWVEKPLMLTASWLAEAKRRCPQALFVCFQDDDPFGTRDRERLLWSHFVEAIPCYDLQLVKKQANVQEFLSRGAQHVELFMHGVHPSIFHPRGEVPAEARREIVFVGTPLDHRVAHITELLERYELPLHIYGNLWNRRRVYWRNRSHFHGEVVTDRYATLLAGSKICLGYVSSSNRDEYSMRTFEIPGCASMLLAERTPTHLTLFEEGVEAEFFESAAECADKCRFYLQNDAARRRVATAGYERCMRSGYLLSTQLAAAVAKVQALRS